MIFDGCQDFDSEVHIEKRKGGMWKEKVEKVSFMEETTFLGAEMDLIMEDNVGFQ